ncbi:MAG: Methyltransferase protein [Magnetococcales bacterium]|nr:Methyltransferase protein [Magnetococcales bacterium]
MTSNLSKYSREKYKKQYFELDNKSEADKSVNTYDRTAWSVPCQEYLLAFFSKTGTVIRGKKILIVGPETKAETERFIQGGADVTVINIAFPEAVLRRSPNYHPCWMDLHHLGFIDNAFDFVYIQHVCMHVDIEKVVQEIRSVLKPGGKMILLEVLGSSPYILFFRNILKVERFMGHSYVTFRDLSNIEDKNFRIERIAGFYVFLPIFYLLKYFYLSRLFKALMLIESRLIGQLHMFRPLCMFGMLYMY